MQNAVYTRTAVVLHWLTGVCVLAQITLGLWMVTIPKTPPGVRAGWFNVHKSVGMTLGVLLIARLLWRFVHRAPPLPATLPKWERTAAGVNHALLYVCMIVLPVSGYLGSSFTKYPILYFGTQLPQWGWDSPALKELCSQLHYTSMIILCALIALHIAAALKHAFIARDGIIKRMWFQRRGA